MNAIRLYTNSTVFKGLVVLAWIITIVMLSISKAQSITDPFTDIKPVMSLTGQWSTSTNAPQVQIKMDNNGRSFTLDMQALDRPIAYGEFISDQVIEVNFPDSQALTGTLDPVQKTITWSNQTSWALVYPSTSTNSTQETRKNTHLVELKR
jgi:hypothetical protein